MHPLILGAGLCLAAMGPAGVLAASAAGKRPVPEAACPTAGAALQERFFSADCVHCWAKAPGLPQRASGPGRRWVFDWIVPTNLDAPLAAGALPESAERAARSAVAALSAEQATERLQAPRALPTGLQLRASSGPAWQGYFGVQLSVRSARLGSLPAGSTGWVALVEQVPAGSDGTAVARALVRTVAGPLSLDALAGQAPGRPLTQLRALRWPASAEPTRLQARAWIEGPDGTILAVAADQCR